MKKRFFPFIIGLAALAVSGSAAFYSVFGLSKLFAGASLQVIIMAGSLEFAKLVCASLLYQYWNTINKFLRFYLSVAVFVLMVITSGGIYGFLSGAYQETATKSEFLDKSLAVLETKQIRFEENKTDLTSEKSQLNTTISNLRTSLSNPAQVSYYSEDAGQVITTTSSSTRKALQKELDATIVDRNNINLKLEAVQDSIMRLDTELLELEIGNEEQRELVPLKYLAETTGKDIGQIVNWFLLLIIFVFDPLAIAMVVAANFAFAQIKPSREDETKEYFQQRNKALEKVVMSVPKGKKFNTPYPIPKTATHPPKKEKIGLDVLIDIMEEEAAEQRMNIVGQNGNDGLHYEDEKSTDLYKQSESFPQAETDDKEDIYQEKEETPEERRIRLQKEYDRKKQWGRKG